MVIVFCKTVTSGAAIATELPNGVDRAIIYESPLLPDGLTSRDKLGDV